MHTVSNYSQKNDSWSLKVHPDLYFDRVFVVCRDQFQVVKMWKSASLNWESFTRSGHWYCHYLKTGLFESIDSMFGLGENEKSSQRGNDGGIALVVVADVREQSTANCHELRPRGHTDHHPLFTFTRRLPFQPDGRVTQRKQQTLQISKIFQLF